MTDAHSPHPEEAEPIHRYPPSRNTSFADRLLFPAWVVSMAGFLLWLLTLGVNV